MLFGVKYKNAASLGRVMADLRLQNARSLPRPSRVPLIDSVAFLEGRAIVGSGKVASLLKLFFAGVLRLDCICNKARVSQIIFPFFEEFVFGFLLIHAPQESRAAALRVSRSCICISLGNWAMVVTTRLPQVIDARYVVLRMLELKPIQFLVHNRACHKVLYWLSLRKRTRLPVSSEPPAHQTVRFPKQAIVSIVDSREKETFQQYLATVGAAFRRFGIQFREIDIAHGPLRLAEVSGAPLVVMGQQGTLRRLDALPGPPARILNFDYLSLNKPGHRPSWICAPQLRRIAVARAYVGAIELDFPESLSFYLGTPLPHGVLKLESGDCPYFQGNHPDLFHCFFDHLQAGKNCFGAPSEALFLIRSVVLDLVTSPVVVKECPRFLMLKIDDVTLEKSGSHLAQIAKTRVHANIGLFLNELYLETLDSKLKNDPALGFVPHSAGWKHSYWKDVIRKKEYDEQALGRGVAHIEGFFSSLAIPRSGTANLHFYAMQPEAVPYLRRLGFEASMMYGPQCSESPGSSLKIPQLASYRFAPGPCGLFLMSAEDHHGFRYALSNTWDFLKRCTKPTGKGSVEKAIARGYAAAKRAFVAGFPAILSTHEYRLLRFRPEEIFEIIQGIMIELRRSGLQPEFCSGDHLSNYMKSFLQAGSVEAHDADGQLVASAERPPRMDLRCHVHYGQLESEEVTIAQGSATAQVTGGWECLKKTAGL